MAAEVADTHLVYVADRESDIIELMRCAQDLGTPADWLVRAKHNRCLPEGHCHLYPSRYTQLLPT